MAKLEALGFEWSPPKFGGDRTDEAGWKTMLLKIAAFKTEHKLCRVPKNHPADPKVGLLVSTQRRNKTKLAAGGPKPRMTAERVAKLEALGFEWVVFKRK